MNTTKKPASKKSAGYAEKSTTQTSSTNSIKVKGKTIELPPNTKAMPKVTRKTTPKTEVRFESEQTEMHEIIGTPFNLCRDDKKWFVIMGIIQLDSDDDRETLLNRWVKPTWNKIMLVILAVLEHEKKGLTQETVEVQKEEKPE